MIQRNRRTRSKPLMESLEPRTLLSVAYAVFVMQAPASPAQPVQTDQSVPAAPGNSGNTGLASDVDIQIRFVGGGIYVTAAVSSDEVISLKPTGTVDFYSDSGFMGTVELGGSMRSAIVLPAGTHTLLATYAGDDNFNASQSSVTKVIPATSTRSSVSPAKYTTNQAGERNRPTRFLSRTDFFTAEGAAVATPGAIPPAPGNAQPADLPSGPPTPTPRFSNISFSVKLSKIASISFPLAGAVPSFLLVNAGEQHDIASQGDGGIGDISIDSPGIQAQEPVGDILL
jgi:hypothetical protein